MTYLLRRYGELSRRTIYTGNQCYMLHVAPHPHRRRWERVLSRCSQRHVSERTRVALLPTRSRAAAISRTQCGKLSQTAPRGCRRHSRAASSQICPCTWPRRAHLILHRGSPVAPMPPELFHPRQRGHEAPGTRHPLQQERRRSPASAGPALPYTQQRYRPRRWPIAFSAYAASTRPAEANDRSCRFPAEQVRIDCDPTRIEHCEQIALRSRARRTFRHISAPPRACYS